MMGCENKGRHKKLETDVQGRRKIAGAHLKRAPATVIESPQQWQELQTGKIVEKSASNLLKVNLEICELYLQYTAH
jgi:hypothetical protein